MDWYSWLSNSGLEPSLVYDYSLLFTHNELEEDDITHFNHEFLLSMGISVAKHRLEILKWAKKHSRQAIIPQPLARLMSAVNKTKKRLARYLTNTLSSGRDRTAIVVVPKAGGGRWKGTILKRNRRVVMLKQGRLLITDGKIGKSGDDDRAVPVKHGASPMVVGGGGDEFWGSGGEEEIRWDSMFQDLKPT